MSKSFSTFVKKLYHIYGKALRQKSKNTLQAIIPYILPDKELRRVGRGIIFKSEYRVIPIF